MAKRWSEVEQSQEFQSLSSQQKIKAKREYWNSVVIRKPQYNKLSVGEKTSARKEFLGVAPLAVKPKTTTPFLPGAEKTQEIISQRKDVLRPAIRKAGEQITSPKEEMRAIGGARGVLPRAVAAGATMPVSPMTALESIGGAFKRAEAGIAAPLLALQKGLPIQKPVSREEMKRIGFKETFKRDIGNFLRTGKILGGEMLKGFSGETQAEIGDVFRTAGAPEPVASTLGFFSTIGLTNLATKGSIVNSTRKAGKFLSRKVPRIMSKDYTLNRAKEATSGLDELHGALSKEYDNVFNRIGNKMINLKKAQSALDDLPDVYLNKISKDKLITRYADGSIHPQLKNVKRMRDIIRKAVPRQVWNGKQMATPDQHFIKEAWYELGNVIAEGNPELVRLNSKYRNFMQMRSTLGRVLFDADGNVKAKGLENLFRSGAERSKQQFFEKFSQQWPQAEQIMKDVIKFNRRQTIKRVAGRAAMVGGTYGLARKVLKGVPGEGIEME
jgi:hypothetical protein